MNFDSLTGVISLIIIELINILIAYRMSEYIISLLVSPKDLPILKELNNFPRVALLYLTYNDAMPEILEKLPDQIYPAYEIFVLDDSTDGKYREVIDRFPYRIIRRDHRGGFKAGAINNWLHQFGKDYRYFIILDSDSVITPDFISSMVRYAEHPDNEKIAVFQSKWLIWNTQNQFPAIIGTLYPLWFYSFYKLANFYDTPMIMGHNNLLRTAYVQEVHGFDEEYVCEDLAISLKLIEAGYSIRYVDLYSYEACPETANSYGLRNIRWGKGTIEIAKGKAKKLPFLENFHLFMAIYFYMIYLFYLPGMFIVTWGYTSTFQDVGVLLSLILSGRIMNTPVFIAFLVIGFYFILFYLIRLPLAIVLKIPLKRYFQGMLLIPAIDFYMLIPMIRGVLETLMGKKVLFSVTDKRRHSQTFSGIFMDMGAGVIIWILLVLGVLINPVSFVFNFFWLIPFICAPWIIYWAQKN